MSLKKRIGLVSASASRNGGGVFEALVTHCEILNEIGFEPVVLALRDSSSAIDRHRFGDAEVITSSILGPKMIGFAPALLNELHEAAIDIVHLHGIWTYPSAAASRWSAQTGLPYIISPHGMLDPWIISRGKFKKAVAQALYERRSWRRAVAFHALTHAEADDIWAATGRKDSFVIANAVAEGSGIAERQPIVAYLGRIHPKKNINGLILGWQLARDALAPLGARLRIAGWGDDEHVVALKAQIDRDGGNDIEFLGPLFDADKANLIGSARFLALPSHSEGLPMVILEAWARGTPTLMSQQCHIPEGYSEGAAFDCGTEPTAIAATLRQAMIQPTKAWMDMHAAAKRLIRKRFTHAVIADRWREIYNGLMSGRVGYQRP